MFAFHKVKRKDRFNFTRTVFIGSILPSDVRRKAAEAFRKMGEKNLTSQNDNVELPLSSEDCNTNKKEL